MDAPAPPAHSFLPGAPLPPVEWTVSRGLIAYPDAVRAMEARVGRIIDGTAPEQAWLLEHPPLYTAGTSALDSDLLTPGRFPVFRTGRGGQFTYHGPGQRVVYAMLDLNRRSPDVRAFVQALEEWIIRTIAEFGITGERRKGMIGVWVRRPDKGPDAEEKIAAVGIRLRRWVSFHGVALNVAPDLSHFAGIVPCGIRERGVASLADLGVDARMADVDRVLRREFETVFGPTRG